MKIYKPLIILALLATGCSSDEPAPADEPTEPEVPTAPVTFELTAAESRAAEATRGFIMDFFRAICASKDVTGTISTSPVSASILLAMTANACDAETRRQIVDAIGCNDIEALNSLSNKFLEAMPLVDPEVKTALANSVWYHKGYTLNTKFADIIDKHYAGEKYGRNLQTGDQTVANEINAWVGGKTEGLIDKIISTDDLNKETVMIMANALYFKGSWANPFEPDNTAKKDFVGATQTTKIDMMQHTGMQHYAESDNFQAVKMEYGKGAFEAVIVLPAEGLDINEFIASDELDKLANLKYNDEPIEFSLPKLKIEARKIWLNAPLAAMGIRNIGEMQNYSIFTETIEAKSNIYQKATIEFTEEGAEGAAITWNGMVTAPGPDAPAPAKPVMNVNRPFVFFINETTTGACLFATRVTDL